MVLRAVPDSVNPRRAYQLFHPWFNIISATWGLKAKSQIVAVLPNLAAVTLALQISERHVIKGAAWGRTKQLYIVVSSDIFTSIKWLCEGHHSVPAFAVIRQTLPSEQPPGPNPWQH